MIYDNFIGYFFYTNNRFKVKDSFKSLHIKSDETIPVLTHTNQKNDEIKNLMCNSCKQNILNSCTEYIRKKTNIYCSYFYLMLHIFFQEILLITFTRK